VPTAKTKKKKKKKNKKAKLAMSSSDGAVKCNACHCNLPLDAIYEDDDGLPFCERDFLQLYCTCTSCNKLIEDGQPSVRLDSGTGELYHVACLKCAHCHVLITAAAAAAAAPDHKTDGDGEQKTTSAELDNLFQFNGLVYCERDYKRQFSQRCSHCTEFITGGESIFALDRHWQPEHFRCAGPCGKPLDDCDYIGALPLPAAAASSSSSSTSSSSSASESKGTIEEETETTKEMPYCMTCYVKTFRMCCACGTQVEHKGLQVGPDKLSFHLACHGCCVCMAQNGGLITGVPVMLGRDGDSQLYCQQHYAAKFSEACTACCKPLASAVGLQFQVIKIGAAGCAYHPACIVCCVCSADLRSADQHVFQSASSDEVRDAPRLYCRTHYTELKQAAPCFACKKPMLEGAVLAVNEHELHRACVKCAVCSVALGTAAQQLYCAPDGSGAMYCGDDYLATCSPPA
jgi:hypothetical protein